MYVYVCVCVHACTWAQGMHMPWQVWEGQGLVLSFFPEGPQGSDSGYQTWRQGPLPAVPSCRPSVFFYVHWDRAFMGNRIVYVTYLTLDWFLVQNSDSIRISDCGVCMCSDACVCIPACMHVCVLCVCEHVCSDNNHSCHSQQYYPLPLRQDSHGPGAYQLGMNSPSLPLQSWDCKWAPPHLPCLTSGNLDSGAQACKTSPLPAEPQLPILYNGKNPGLLWGVGIIPVKCWALNWFTVQSGESIRTL